MDDSQLKQLFESQEIPAPNHNRRKEALNLAAAAFEKNQKTAQGTSLWGRLMNRQPTTRRDPMSFSKKKVIYGGMATACVALMVFAVSPYSRLASTQARIVSSLATTNGTNTPGAAELSPTMQNAMDEYNDQNLTEAINTGNSVMPIPTEPAKSFLPAPPTEKDTFAEVRKAPTQNAVDAATVDDMRRQEEQKILKKEKADDTAADRAAPAEAEMAAGSSVNGAIMAMPVSPPGNPQLMPVPIQDVIATADKEIGRDKFKDFQQNDTKQVGQEPVSTFSIDVDTASYSFVRQSLTNGTLPQIDAVRVEELINYFDYAYPLPESKAEPFKTSVVVKPSPWHEGRKLVTVGIKGFDTDRTTAPDSNLVFLLDVSGSMDEPNKLPLLKQSLTMLLDSLKATDKVSIVVYAGAAGTVLPPTPVSDKASILSALQNLQPGGSTAGAEGIRLAYQLAEANFNKNAVNRVILATDGDFNVGITSPDELQDFVERKRESGVFLSVLGFGTGNYNDDMMQRLAQNGNGVAAYIDNLNEARKVLVREAGSTLFTIAKDVKIQVEFNPATVSEYRLVGYETRALKTEDFNNDKVDAGDIGAGAEVTAIYEVTPVGLPQAIDKSRYADKSSPAESSVPATNGELAFVKVRYKLPEESVSKLVTTPVLPDMNAGISGEAQKIQKETDWAVAVASFGQLLKGGKYTGSMTYDDVLKLAESSKGADPYGTRAEFINLVYQAKTAAAMQSQGGMPYQSVPGEAR